MIKPLLFTPSMKHALLSFFLLTFSFSITYAQSDSSRHRPNPYLDLSVGVSLAPQAVFMPKDINYWMDFAQPGFNINVSGGAPLFHSCFGITGQFSYYSNVYNMAKYVNAIPPQTNEAFTSSSYGSFTQYAFMVGVFAAYKIDKTTLELKAMAGLESVTLPNYAYLVTYPAISSYSEVDSYFYNTSLSATFGAGLQIAYSITKSLAIIYNSDIIISSVPFTESSYRNATPSNATGSGNAQIFMFNAALGVRYNFGK